MKGVDRSLRNWSLHILEWYVEMGQWVYEDDLYKQLRQYYEEGEVTGLFNANSDREEIKAWLSNIAKTVNQGLNLKHHLDDVLLSNTKRKNMKDFEI